MKTIGLVVNSLKESVSAVISYKGVKTQTIYKS